MHKRTPAVYYHGLTTKTLYMEKKKKKQAEKENRQRMTADWIQENYLQFKRLRADTVRQRIQIMTSPNPSFKGGEFRYSEPSPCGVPASNVQWGALEGGAGGGLALWRDLTDRDINDMVCQCCAETGAAVTSREVLTVLHSSMLPQVHPLREYVEQQNAYDAQNGMDHLTG